ncbi:MAG: hypothetical protein OJF50_005562 [Nitrospira sp.]|nr:hypothetical protein [Nitrospira sp.]
MEVYKTPPSGATFVKDVHVLVNQPGGTPKVQFTENKGYRWYS